MQGMFCSPMGLGFMNIFAERSADLLHRPSQPLLCVQFVPRDTQHR